MASAGGHWTKGNFARTTLLRGQRRIEPKAKPAAEPEPPPTTFTATGQGTMFGGGEDLPLFTGGAYGGTATPGMGPSLVPGTVNPAAGWARRYDANQRRAAVRGAFGRR